MDRINRFGIWASALASTFLALNVGRAQSNWSVVSRGLDYNVLQTTNAVNGTNCVHRITVLSDGLNYTNSAGQLVESSEQITIQPDGSAAATQGQHTVRFPADIYNGVLQVTTPDGRNLLSRPLCICYDDGSNTVVIATLTNAIGCLTASNQVTYPNCFCGINADIVATYRRSGFECDLVFRSQPPSPSQWNLDSSFCTLQLVTEFFNAQDPQQIPAGNDGRFGLQDTTLKFGKLTMTHGKAFAFAETNSETSIATLQYATPVYKSWVHTDDGRKFLVEQVPLANIADQLNALPLSASISNPASRISQLASVGHDVRSASPSGANPDFAKHPAASKHLASLLLPARSAVQHPAPLAAPKPDEGGSISNPISRITDNGSRFNAFPSSHGILADTNHILLASGDFKQNSRLPRRSAAKAGVVLDYDEIISDQLNFTFQSGETYWIEDSVTLGDGSENGTSVLFQGGAVIKFSPNATWGINYDGYDASYQTTSANRVILTSESDDSVGEVLPSSTGHPVTLTNITYFPFVNNVGYTPPHFDFCYAGVGMIPADPAPIYDCRFYNCYQAIQMPFGEVDIYNCLFSKCNTIVDYNFDPSDSTPYESITCENVTADDGVQFMSDNVNSLSFDMVNYDWFDNFTYHFYNCFATRYYIPFFSCTCADPVLSSCFEPAFNSPLPYATAGRDNYYLASSSPYRGVGTPDDILDMLQTATTYAPQDGSNPDLAGTDIGYHYPIDEDSAYDGVPDSWKWEHFQNFSVVGSDLASNGHTLLYDYLNGLDPGFTIITQPMSQTVFQGDTVTLVVVVAGSGPFTYRWQMNGTDIPDAQNSSSYTINNYHGTGNFDQYTVIISDGTQALTSNPAEFATVAWNPYPETMFPKFMAVTGSRQDYTFKSGVTYVIENPIELYGNTVIEPNAVIKFDWYYGNASLIINGSLSCEGAQYNPAVLTSIDDGSVGLAFFGAMSSDGPPQVVPGTSPYLDLSKMTGNVTLSNLWVRFADQGIITPPDRLDCWDCQFYECNEATVATQGSSEGFHNVLFAKCSSAVASCDTFADEIDGEQVTADVGDFCSIPYPPVINLTNSLLLTPAINGQPVNFEHSCSATRFSFEPSDCGNYYLAPNTYQHLGTPNISPQLLAEFKNKTTAPPLKMPANMLLSGQMTLLPEATRYTGGAPDRGYYYDALDYSVANVSVVGGSITVEPGTAIATRNEYAPIPLNNPNSPIPEDYGWTDVGFILANNSSFNAHGTPNKPITFSAEYLVQETPNTNFAFAQGVPFGTITFLPDFLPDDNNSAPPTLDLRFCNLFLSLNDYHVWSGGDEYSWTWQGNLPYEASPDSAVNLTMRDCNLHGGRVNLGNPDLEDYWAGDPVYGAGAVTWTNNLFEDVVINLDPTFYEWGPSGGVPSTMEVDLALQVCNNLFRNCPYMHLEPIPASAGNWYFRNNLFDKVDIFQDLFQLGLPLDCDYNGYWPLVTSELTFGGQYDSGQLKQTASSTGNHELVLNSNPPYQSGPLGNYYLPNTTPLHGAGSDTAANLGLYHYTTQLDQTKEGEDISKVAPNLNANIGLHYIAVDSFGKPVDTDSDGIPDYVENWHGDGDTAANGATRIHITDETDWKNPATATDPTTGNPIPDASNSIYDNVDLDGDGLTGSAERALGTNPLIPDNPLTLTPYSASNPDTISFGVPLGFDLLNNVGSLSLNANGNPIPLLRYDKNSDSSCLLTGTTTFQQPGLNLMQLTFTVNGQITNNGVGLLVCENLNIQYPPYAFSLKPGSASWNSASISDRVASGTPPSDWQSSSTSWQMFCSAITSPYFEVIWIPGYRISDFYDAAKNGTMQVLNLVEQQPDFGANVLRYLDNLDINSLVYNDFAGLQPGQLDYVVIAHMAGLNSSLSTMDQSSLQKLFQLAAWDSNQFSSTGEIYPAAAAIELMYAVYNLPESTRGVISGVLLPPLTTDEIDILEKGGLPPEIIPTVQSVVPALGLTSRP